MLDDGIDPDIPAGVCTGGLTAGAFGIAWGFPFNLCTSA